MSTIVKQENKFCHVVECGGKTYFVVSGSKYAEDMVTWVCIADKGQFDYYSDWDELYKEKHSNMKDMEYRHMMIARHLEQFINGREQRHE